MGKMQPSKDRTINIPITIAKNIDILNFLAIKEQIRANTNGKELRCVKCNALVEENEPICAVCGTALDKNTIVVSEKIDDSVTEQPKKTVLPTNFDKMYSLTEDKMLEEFIKKELILIMVIYELYR